VDLKTYESLVRSESSARRYLLSFCWKNHQRFCPRCRHRKNYRLASGRRRCARCRYTFHDFTGRWINTGNLTSADWLRLLKLFELRLTAMETARQLGITYNTAYKATNVVRLAILSAALDARQLLGPGSALGFNLAEGGREDAGGGTAAPVFGIMERGGIAFADFIPGFTAETLLHFHLNFRLGLARMGNVIYTDSYQRYDSLVCCVDDGFSLDYLRGRTGPVSVDAKKGFWRFVRERLASFHGVTWRRFPLYLKEVEFRFNNQDRDIYPMLAEYLCRFVPELDREASELVPELD